MIHRNILINSILIFVIGSILIYSMFIGIVIRTLLNLPAPAFISLIAAICSPFAFLSGLGSAFGTKYPLDSANKEFGKLNKLYIAPFISFAMIVVVNRLLVYGFYWN